MRQAAAALERRAVPALIAQLVLTLVDCDVQALERRRRHVGAAQAQAQLPLAQARQRQADCVGGHGSPPPGSFKPRISLPRALGTEKASQVCGPGLRPLRRLPDPPLAQGFLLAGWVTEGLLTDCTTPGTGDREARGRRPRPGLLPHVESWPEGPDGQIEQGLQNRDT